MTDVERSRTCSRGAAETPSVATGSRSIGAQAVATTPCVMLGLACPRFLETGPMSSPASSTTLARCTGGCGGRGADSGVLLLAHRVGEALSGRAARLTYAKPHCELFETRVRSPSRATSSGASRTRWPYQKSAAIRASPIGPAMGRDLDVRTGPRFTWCTLSPAHGPARTIQRISGLPHAV